MVSKKQYLITVVILLLFCAGFCFGGVIIGSHIGKGELVTQFVATENIERGHPIVGKFKQVVRSADDSVSKNVLVSQPNQLKGAIALTPIYKNAPITITSVAMDKKTLDRNIEISIPVTVLGVDGNNVKANDIVALKVDYKKKLPDDVVVSKITIKEVKSANGAPLEGSALPGIVVIDVTKEEASDLHNAAKEGNLYCAKYNDLSKEPLAKSYDISVNHLPD